MDFAKIAPYLKDPLVLIGFFLFVAFSFSRLLVKQKVIPPLPPTLGFRILKTLLLYGFIIGLLLICLGFAVKYKDLQDRRDQAEADLMSRENQAKIDREIQAKIRAEQQEAVRLQQVKLVQLLQGESDSNLRVAGELQKNSVTLLGEFSSLSSLLRTPGIKLLAMMFSTRNIDPAVSDAEASSLADEAFENLRSTGLYRDDLEREKLTAAARAMSATIDATSSTVESLSDREHRRYRFSTEVWDSNLPALRTILISDVSVYQKSYADLGRLRDDYDVVTSRFREYLSALREFLDPEKHMINVESLRRILAQERFTYSLLTAFGKALLKDSRTIRDLVRTLHAESIPDQARDASAKPSLQVQVQVK